MPTLLGIDGNSLAHRAYHAGVNDPDVSGAWVTDIFMRMLCQVWLEGPFDAIVIGFDHERNIRKERWPHYKGHRSEKDEELTEQLAMVPEHLADCGFWVCCEDGVEADDLLAAMAHECDDRGWNAKLLSSDRDLLPLVSEHVTLLRPKTQVQAMTAYTPAKVLAQYGVTPSQYHELAALRGDPSDGLPGVHGIGAKTAARLLRDYGSVAEIYRNLVFLPPKAEACLRRGRARFDHNIEVMTPIPDVAVDLDAALADGVDPELAEAALTALGLGQVGGRFRSTVERPIQPIPPPPEHETGDLLAMHEPLPAVSLIGAAHDGEQDSLFDFAGT